MPARRGRGRKKAGTADDGDEHVNVNSMVVMKVPVTERDEEQVQCRLCRKTMVFREFRLHNMGQHSNCATTVDDSSVLRILE